MINQEWQGGKKDQRLYQKVRSEKQERILEKYERLKPYLDERGKRLWAANEAIAFGEGGIRAVSEALQMGQGRVIQGRRELLEGPAKQEANGLKPGRQRRAGGGRKSVVDKQPGVVAAIEAIVDPETRGDPMKPLKWTSKSLSRITTELRQQGWQIGETTVEQILRQDLGYSLQALQKTREGTSHPDRDAQFRHLNQQCQDFQQRGQPVISVDTKKKELVGDFKNGGQEWQPTGEPEPVRVHDFQDKQLGKGVPYGVYDTARNQGWVSVGNDHDTAEFAVSSIRQWWQHMGSSTYPQAKELLITADAGGSNGYRPRLWKRELQKLADDTGLRITVCHFPPGTSKWNKIEHRMFSRITENWRGRPLTSLEVIVNLIANTTTRTGLTIQAALDNNTYAKGISVSDDEMSAMQIKPADFHGEWNYTITSRNSALPQPSRYAAQI
jgi:hypothetical protein